MDCRLLSVWVPVVVVLCRREAVIAIKAFLEGSFLLRGNNYKACLLYTSLSLDEAKLRGALSTDRNAVASLLSEDQAGPEGILVNLRKTMEMYTAYGGFLPVKDAQLASQDKDISRQIQNLERRLELRLANLKRQFTALEVLLTKMDSQRLWFCLLYTSRCV